MMRKFANNQLKESRDSHYLSALSTLAKALTFSVITVSATHAEETKTEKAAEHATLNAMMVSIDPETGVIQAPTAAQQSELLEAMKARISEQGFVMPKSNEEAALTRQALPSGGVAVRVPESLMSSVQATVNDKGELTLHHGEHAAEVPNE